MTARRVTAGRVTSGGGLAGAVLAIATLVAACGGDGGAGTGSDTGAEPPAASAAPSASSVTPSPTPTPTPTPGSSALVLPVPATHHPTSAPNAAATRVEIPSLGIDLPVMSGDATLPGNPPGYPLCDVAQYLTAYGDPGEPGATYLYAHAREGMFLPLLEASRRDGGQELLGREVLVHAADGAVHRYVVFTVVPHATDRRIADTVRPGDHRLVLQTSEGPRGTVPKLQVAARYAGSRPAAPSASAPEPSPRACA